MEEGASPPRSKSWSIHSRREIIDKYEILERVGYGAYSDVYKARRLSDSLIVALKEVHDYQSAFREVEALQTLQNCPNVIVLHEFFWSEDEDAVLVLEYLPTDLAAVIEAAKREWENGISVGEIKQWMMQILRGVGACHRNFIVHRDLKPSNLLISVDGVLKIADFGQARIQLTPGFSECHGCNQFIEPPSSNEGPLDQAPELISAQCVELLQEQAFIGNEKTVVDSDNLRSSNIPSDIDDESVTHDGAASCLATCTTSDLEDPFQTPYSYEVDETRVEGTCPLTSCVGTRWYKAPELLYGSTNYGLEIDLWSIGCIFAELLSLEPLFLGTSDIDQLNKIYSILGKLTAELWPGCEQLPDYHIISFGNVEKPIGLEACLRDRSLDEVRIVEKLLPFNPSCRALPSELLEDKYFKEEPLPAPLSELRVPSTHASQDQNFSPPRDYNFDPDFEDFGSSQVTTTKDGFSIQFS